VTVDVFVIILLVASASLFVVYLWSIKTVLMIEKSCPMCVRPSATTTFLLEWFLAYCVAGIAGVDSVRLLTRRDRPHYENPYLVFIILSGADIERDRLIVQRMGQVERVDYNLVPSHAAGMIPYEAKVVSALEP
jgi:hypothetical protein